MENKQSKPMWECPVCSKKRFIYGVGCPEFNQGFCPNEVYAHSTGQWYLDRDNWVEKEAEAIGIGAITDEK